MPCPHMRVLESQNNLFLMYYNNKDLLEAKQDKIIFVS